MRASYSPAFGGERGDRGLDDLDLLAAKLTAFARMRIEARHSEPGLGDPKIALQAAKRCAAPSLDQ